MRAFLAAHTAMPRTRLLSAALASCLLLGCSTAARPPEARPLAIGAVQGRDGSSPHAGERVTVEGMVTMTTGKGWFLQDTGDGDESTSDALWIDDPDGQSGVSRGDRIRVSGVVTEQPAANGTRTALLQPQATKLGQGVVNVVELADIPGEWERYESMSVAFTAPLNLDGSHDLERRGQVLASLGERPWQATERATPGSAQWQDINAGNARRQLWLQATPDAAWPGAIAHARTGSRLQNVAGVIDESGDGRGLYLTAPAELQPASRPQAPQVEGNLRIAALNLENLFNGDGKGGGFPTPRGARTPAELAAQLAKHVATLRGLGADVVALMELENDGYGRDSSLAALVAALNAGGGDWRFVDAGQGPGDNPIRVGLIYRAGRVRPQGKPATLEGGPFGPHSRVPLAQAFLPLQRGRVSGPAFVVAANHFKSKGCSGAEAADRDQHDGAACWNAIRTESAHRLAAWLQTDPTRSGSDLSIIVGDLNAYAQETPVRALAEAGWRDAFAVAGVEAAYSEAPYSYVYDGRIGRLDHALLSPALAARLRGAAEWHSNADEPETSGYRDGGEGPWRSSDHDPLLLGFDLRR